jgi:DNA-binding response OmpR family regulator
VARILLIEDDEPLRRALAFGLAKAGHAVDVADDGAGGFALFQRSGYDLVVTDIFMPGQEGILTIRQLRAAAPDLKIIAISGGTVADGFDPLVAAGRLGADRTLRKPIRSDELVRTVNELLE